MDKQLKVRSKIHTYIPYNCGQVVVRPYKLKDVKLFCKYTSDNTLVKYLLCSTNKGYQAVRRFVLGVINRYQIEKVTRFVIVDKETDNLVGALSIYLSEDGTEAELGYWIGREFWGKGYMSSVLINTVDFLKDIEEIERIFIESDINNIGSIKSAERAGLIYNKSKNREIGGRQLLTMELVKEEIQSDRA